MTDAKATAEKRSVALTSVVAAVFLTVMKAGMGIATGSLGLLSEAAHSGLDLVAALVTFFAVRASGKPADREHTYGHGKIENLSALFETLLLLGTCVWIVREAVRRLFFMEVHVEANVWSFAVVMASIVIDFSRSRALMRVAKKYRSQALEADALHFSTDIWSSAVVLFGLVLVWFSDRLGIPWMVKADALAAMVVAAIVVWISVRLGRRTVDDLLDAVPGHLTGEIRRAAMVPGVAEVRNARVRRSGPHVFADLTLAVSDATPFTSAHEIAHEAEESVRRLLPDADVVVHVDPLGETHDSFVGKIRDTAARYGFNAHALAISSGEKEGTVEMHLEVDPSLSVAEAHEKVTAFENEIRTAAPTFPKITTHIEPRGGDLGGSDDTGAGDLRKVRELLDRIAGELKKKVRLHDLAVRREDRRLVVSFHCGVEGTLGISEAHDLTTFLETRLRAKLQGISRVVIHIEPLEKCEH